MHFMDIHTTSSVRKNIIPTSSKAWVSRIWRHLNVFSVHQISLVVSRVTCQNTVAASLSTFFFNNGMQRSIQILEICFTITICRPSKLFRTMDQPWNTPRNASTLWKATLNVGTWKKFRTFVTLVKSLNMIFTVRHMSSYYKNTVTSGKYCNYLILYI